MPIFLGASSETRSYVLSGVYGGRGFKMARLVLALMPFAMQVWAVSPLL